MKQENWYDVDSLRQGGFSMSTAFPALMRKVFVWDDTCSCLNGPYGLWRSHIALACGNDIWQQGVVLGSHHS